VVTAVSRAGAICRKSDGVSALSGERGDENTTLEETSQDMQTPDLWIINVFNLSSGLHVLFVDGSIIKALYAPDMRRGGA
jgi:hypothetical protein